MWNLQPNPTFVRYFVQTTLMIRFISFMLFSAISLSVFSQSDTIFEKVFYTSNTEITARSIAPTHEDGAVFVSAMNYQNSVITKVDSAGMVLWNKHFSSSTSLSYPGLRLERIILNSDSAYTAIGINLNENSLKHDLCLLRFNADGDTLWSAHFNQAVNNTFNGTHVIESVDSCLLFTAHNEGNGHSFLLKLDFNGNVIWKKEMYTTIGHKITSVTQASDSTIFVGGWGQSGPNPPFSFVSAFDHTGNILWSKELSGFILNDIHHRDSALFMVGYGDNAVSMIRMQEDGSAINWANSYMLSASNDNSDRMELTPLSNGDFATVNPDQFFSTALLRVDQLGTLTQFHPLVLDGCALIETKKKGHLILGSGPLIGIHLVPFAHIGLIRTDSLYTPGDCYAFQSPFVQVLNINLTDFTWNFGNDLLQIDNTIIAGEISFDEYDGCVEIYGSLQELGSSLVVHAFPNPANDHIEFSQEDGLPMRIIVMDIMGRTVYQSAHSGSNMVLDLKHLEEGSYFYRATFENNEFTAGKFVVKR